MVECWQGESEIEKMEMSGEAWVAGYAAIVATGALALEIRRWFESGPKLYVRARGGMVMIDGDDQHDNMLVVNVTNRGDTPTTIETLAVLRFKNRWKRWRLDATDSYIILHPQPAGSPPVIPSVLQPGHKWTGLGHDRSDVTGDIQTGHCWAAIYTTDRDRPYLAHIPKKATRKELDDADKI
jgi:hypothetical protein